MLPCTAAHILCSRNVNLLYDVYIGIGARRDVVADFAWLAADVDEGAEKFVGARFEIILIQRLCEMPLKTAGLGHLLGKIVDVCG